MDAINFDLDTGVLRERHHNPSRQNACGDVGRALGAQPDRYQGSACFGDDTADAVTRVLAVQQLAAEHGWFKSAVKDIRMLRIEDNNDPMPAVERG